MRSWTIWAVLVLFAAALVCMPGCQKKQETPATEQETMEATPDTSVQVAANCPVCGTAVPEGSTFTSTYEGTTYGFCCAECMDKFVTSPTSYVNVPGTTTTTTTTTTQ